MQRTVILLVLVIVSGILSHAPASASSDVSYQVFAQVNHWRVQHGLWPLVWNDDLAQMANAQAVYIRENVDVFDYPDELVNGWHLWHVDEQARSPYERAIALGWPGYSENVVIGENGAYGRLQGDIAPALQDCTALDPRFRETGVAVVPAGDDTYVVYQSFGSRPGVLPALHDPTTGTLHLSTEFSAYAGDSPMGNVNVERILKRTQCARHANLNLPADDSEALTLTAVAPDGRVIVQDRPYSLRVNLPTDTPSQFEIQFSNGMTTTVDLTSAAHMAVLPGTVDVWRRGDDLSQLVWNAPTAESEIVVSQDDTPMLDSKLMGAVNVSAGANLQCREYPDAEARSLGLIPSGAQVSVDFMAGPRDNSVGRADAIQVKGLPKVGRLAAQNMALERFYARGFADGVALDNLWLYVTWVDSSTNGLTHCWTNALFLTATYEGETVAGVRDYLTLVDKMALELLPYNVPAGMVKP